MQFPFTDKTLEYIHQQKTERITVLLLEIFFSLTLNK